MAICSKKFFGYNFECTRRFGYGGIYAEMIYNSRLLFDAKAFYPVEFNGLKGLGQCSERIHFQTDRSYNWNIVADGNIIVGPNAESGNLRDDVSTTKEGLDFVAAEANKTTKKINYRENIRSFAGLRANSDKKDFIIGESPLVRHL